jgi:CheY-like chemotaxis protein
MIQSPRIPPDPTLITRASPSHPVVLVVDDEPAIRHLCREILKSAHLRVLTAADGREALALAETCKPDVLVTDVTMPRVDGFGLIRALRRRYPDMPAIVTSGDEEYGGRPVQEVAAEHGAIWTYFKPFDVALLRDVVVSQCQVSFHRVSTSPSSGMPTADAHEGPRDRPTQ